MIISIPLHFMEWKNVVEDYRILTLFL